MSYNILGINPGHNGSAALVSDGKLIYYLEEERLSRDKRDGNPFRSIIDICTNYKIDLLAIGGTKDPLENIELPWSKESPYVALVRKFHPQVETKWYNDYHHLCHAASCFYSSGYEEAAILIIDGAGSHTKIINTENDNVFEGYEGETILKASYKEGIKELYKTYGHNGEQIVELKINDSRAKFDSSLTITKAYEAVTNYLGWNFVEGGKTMGLAPYGKLNPIIPPLFINGRGNKDFFIPMYPVGAVIDTVNNKTFTQDSYGEFHQDKSKLKEIEADLAWQIQNDTQQETLKLVHKAVELTGLKKVCIAGGYGLNCVTNYFLKKNLKGIEIYNEAISHDGGISIGAARLAWYEKNQKPSLKQTSIYYGPKYSNNSLKTVINTYNSMFIQHKTTATKIAKLISERNIVTIFQGRSEAGPRALGNRSILYDPTDPNGKDFVNKVKNREWFRPFAGTVLLEKAHEYFDMAGLEESPFMMYAMDVWPDKQEEIKAITHVDGTCRIQTVTEEQNPHYYKLIQEFEKITGTPILFNTSFNLAGDPLVETIEDALETLLKSEIKYLYLPELETLLEKK